MNRDRFAHLIILAAALGFAACGGAADNPGGDSKTANTSQTVNAASTAPATDGAANAAAMSTNTAPAPAPASSASANAPAVKTPKPQIGSGGNDLFLFTQARAAVNDDADLKASNLIIEVKEGVVTLSGNVASAALKSKAGELARGAGAKDVKNQLRVSAGR
jgi:osmotically-inducible protein OsmY